MRSKQLPGIQARVTRSDRRQEKGTNMGGSEVPKIPSWVVGGVCGKLKYDATRHVVIFG